MTHNYPTKSPKDQQLKGELRGDLGTYAKIGLFQRDISQNTAYRYRGAMLRYQAFLGDNPPTLAASLEYLSGLRKNGFDPSTLRVYAVALRGYHEWRGEDLKFKVKVPKRKTKLVAEEPILKILELSKAKPHDELILRLMTDAGMRRDETVNIAVGAASGGWVRFIGKGDKEREVPMTPRLAELIALVSAGISPGNSLVGVGEKGIYGLVKRYGAAVGHPELAPHDLRRYFGMRVQEISGDIRVTQELLGHSNVNTTQIYTAVRPKRLEDAIAKLGGGQAGEPPKGAEQPKGDVSRMVAELDDFTTKFGNTTVTASDFLRIFWQRFSAGISTREFLTELPSRYRIGVSELNSMEAAVEAMLARLNLYQIIRQEQRIGGTVRDKVNVGYWILTDFGKTLVLKLEAINKERPY